MYHVLSDLVVVDGGFGPLYCTVLSLMTLYIDSMGHIESEELA